MEGEEHKPNNQRRRRHRGGSRRSKSDLRVRRTHGEEEEEDDQPWLAAAAAASSTPPAAAAAASPVELTRTDLREVARDTAELFNTRFPYTSGDDVTVYWFRERFPSMKREHHPDFEVVVTANDALDDCASEVWGGGDKKVLCINSASMKKPGGGWLTGAKAQEECYARRSNLPLALARAGEQCDGWPLHGKLKGIYTPNVTIFKDADYDLLETPFQVDMLSVFSRPRDHIDNRERALLYSNVFESLAYTTRAFNIDTVVFVPVGCGVFGHDPNWVAFELSKYLERVGLGATVSKFIVSCHTNDANKEAFERQLV